MDSASAIVRAVARRARVGDPGLTEYISNGLHRATREKDCLNVRESSPYNHQPVSVGFKNLHREAKARPGPKFGRQLATRYRCPYEHSPSESEASAAFDLSVAPV